MLEVSWEKLGLSLIFPDFPQFIPTFLDFSWLSLIFPNFFTLKGREKLRKTRDRASQHSPNFGTGRVPLPDPDPDLSKSWDGHSDLDLDRTRFLLRYYPPRDILPMVELYWHGFKSPLLHKVVGKNRRLFECSNWTRRRTTKLFTSKMQRSSFGDEEAHSKTNTNLT